MKFSKENIATFLAILFHISGLIGIVFTPYKDWFIQYTPLNLCLMALLLIWNQSQKGISFFLFAIVAFSTGMGSEMIGVHTGKLFGDYAYSDILGPSLHKVPWLIGLNWFIIVLCCGTVMLQFQKWLTTKFAKQGFIMSEKMMGLSLIMDGALLATFFDWIMEPVAIKLGFWYWKNNEVPVYNYVCWLVISAVLLFFFQWFRFKKENHFALHLLVIQLLFFLALNIYV